MDPFELYRGEKRLLSANLAPALAEGDTLSGTPNVSIVKKRGRGATTMLTTPAPALDGNTVEFWVDVPDDQERGNYLALVECATASGELAKEEVPLLVQ